MRLLAEPSYVLRTTESGHVLSLQRNFARLQGFIPAV